MKATYEIRSINNEFITMLTGFLKREENMIVIYSENPLAIQDNQSIKFIADNKNVLIIAK